MEDITVHNKEKFLSPTVILGHYYKHKIVKPLYFGSHPCEYVAVYDMHTQEVLIIS